MDWMVCPNCGQRFLPTELGCPNCPGTARRAISKLQALQVAQAAAPPKRDPALGLLHGVFAASLLWATLGWRAPRWLLAVVAFEVAAAVSAQVPSRLARALVHVRAALYVGGAAVLFLFEIGGPLSFLVFLVHGATAWAFARNGQGTGESIPLGDLLPPARGLGESARRANRSEARTRVRGLILIPVVMTWVFLLGGVRELAR